MSVQFQFISLGDKGTTTQKRMIRSHAAVQHNLRRKEQQRQKAIQAAPSLDSLCTCEFNPSASLPWAETRSSLPDIALTQKVNRVDEKKQRLADSYKICVVCKKLQFNELSRASQVAVMRMLSPQVATFCQADFDPFGNTPDSPWLISPLEKVELNEVKYFIVTFYAPGGIRNFAIPEAIADPGLYMAMLFCGYAWLYGRRGLPMSNTALALKLEAIRHINKKLQDPKQASATTTIASVAYLAAAVRNFGGETAAIEVKAHETALDEMVKLREGALASFKTPYELAVHGILIMHHVVYAGLSATQVSPTFDLKLPASPSPPLTNTEYLPESPFYRPRSSFLSLQESKNCSKTTLEILYDVENIFTRLLERSANGVLSEDLYQAQLLDTYSRISKLESTTKSSDVASSPRTDYYYEACRICSLITLDAMVNSRALWHAPPSLVGSLIETLKKTDIGNAWGDILGVFYWITMTCTAACPQNPGHQFIDSAFGKAQFDMCYTIKRLDARFKPAQRFAAIHLAIVEGPVVKNRKKVLADLRAGVPGEARHKL